MYKKIDCLLIAYSGIDRNAYEYKRLVNKDAAIGDIPVALNSAITYLGTSLNEKELSFNFINSVEGQKEQMLDMIRNDEIISVGISTTICPSIEQLSKLIKEIREIRPEIKIILGGALIVYFLREVREKEPDLFRTRLKGLEADYIIDSIYGEDKLAEIVYAVKVHKNVDEIKDIYFRNKDVFIRSSSIDIADIHEESYVLEEQKINWDLFKGKTGGAVVVRTSLSCCFRCMFCSFPVRAGKYRNMAISHIEAELNDIEALGEVKLVHFIDDTFNQPISRFKEILRMFIKNKYSFKWHCFIRCQNLDDEAAQLMKQSGCIGVFLGLESGSNDVLKAMNKASTVGGYKNGINLLKKYNITIVASFFVGFPGESVKTIKETFKFIKEIEPEFYYLGPWFYEPNTPISRLKEKYGLQGAYNDWEHNGMDSETANRLVTQMKAAIKNSVLLENISYPFLFQLINTEIGLSKIKDFLRAN